MGRNDDESAMMQLKGSLSSPLSALTMKFLVLAVLQHLEIPVLQPEPESSAPHRLQISAFLKLIGRIRKLLLHSA